MFVKKLEELKFFAMCSELETQLNNTLFYLERCKSKKSKRALKELSKALNHLKKTSVGYRKIIFSYRASLKVPKKFLKRKV